MVSALKNVPIAKGDEHVNTKCKRVLDYKGNICIGCSGVQEGITNSNKKSEKNIN